MLDRFFPDATQNEEALHAFWSVYMFERRLSLGQGIPFSIQDSYIDKSLYTIETPNPLLPALLQWTKLAGKTWHAMNDYSEKTYESRVDDIDYLDYQILEWYAALPHFLKLPEQILWTRDSDHAPTYYHSIIFVRKSHLRNLIYRPVLQGPLHSRQNEPIVLKAVEISMETIRVLFQLNERTALVRTHPLFFHQLLQTAFGNLLIAVVSSGSAIRNRSRAEFDMFLNLFHQLSSRCTALRKTWQRLQGLRDLHAKLSHSDRAANAQCKDYDNNINQNLAAVPLSFDDIFPGMDTFNETVAPNTYEDANTGTAPWLENHFVPEDFIDAGNVFDFPFLDLL